MRVTIRTDVEITSQSEGVVAVQARTPGNPSAARILSAPPRIARYGAARYSEAESVKAETICSYVAADNRREVIGHSNFLAGGRRNRSISGWLNPDETNVAASQSGNLSWHLNYDYMGDKSAGGGVSRRSRPAGAEATSTRTARSATRSTPAREPNLTSWFKTWFTTRAKCGANLSENETFDEMHQPKGAAAKLAIPPGLTGRVAPDK
jgi:hypothetical protein